MAVLCATGTALAQSPIEGTWRTEQESEITIEACEEGFCGKISKIIVPEEIRAQNKEALAAMSVEDYTDAKNKDPKLRSRPIMGLQILTFKPANKPLVYDGNIYNPEDGNTYSGYIEVLDADRIKLNGCVLFNVICRGEEWMRVEETEATAPTAKR